MNTIEIIESVVEDIRYSANITNIVDNADGTYTVLTAETEDLVNGDYITIAGTTGFNGQYKISSLVTDTSFNITKTTGTVIPGPFGTWTANSPYFMKGRWSEITRELSDKASSTIYKNQRFELICLIIPFSESKKRKKASPEIEVDLSIYFFTETDDNKNTDWRYTNKFPVLEALEIRFINELKKYIIGEMDVESEWNPHMEGRAYVFTSPVDAWRDTMDVRLYKC